MGFVSTFVGFNGDEYHLRISGSGNDEAIVLSGTPIVTQEDDDEDLFQPIRLQTGYVNIVDQDDRLWRQMMPTSAMQRQVVLTCGNDVVWRGFLKPENYSVDYNVRPQEVQLPLVCTLSVLSGFTLPGVPPVSLGNTPSFRQLIAYIIDDVEQATGWTIPIFYQGVSQDFNMFLDLKVQYGILLDEDSSGIVHARFNNLELLEHICTFLGMTARTYMDGVYFVCPDNTSHIAPMSVVDYTEGFPFMGADNTEAMVQGLHKIEVTSEVNNPDILTAPMDRVVEKNLGNQVTSTSYGTIGRRYELQNVLQYYSSGHMSMSATSRCAFTVVNYIDMPPETGSVEYDWQPRLTQLQAGRDFNTWIKTSRNFTFSRGQLVVRGFVYVDDINEGVYGKKGKTGFIRLRIKVGDYCWTDNHRWELYDPLLDTDFGVSVEVANGQIGYGLAGSSTGWNDTTHFVEGKRIPCPALLSGSVEVTVIDLAYVDTAVHLESLSIEYSRGFSRTTSRNRVVRSSGVAFEDDRSVSCLFASDDTRLDYGLSLVLDSTGYYADIGSGRPESNLANRMATYYGSVHRVLTLDIHDDAFWNITPFSKVEDIKGGEFYCVSMSREWRGSKSIVKLVEL